LDEDIAFDATSGKVYPWAFPSWIADERIKERLWEKLSSKILLALVEQGMLEQRSQDYWSGSDSGRSDLPDDTEELIRIRRSMRTPEILQTFNQDPGSESSSGGVKG
jgi:hypothetical protein